MTLINLTINGIEQIVDVDPETPLLWVLRDIVGLTGTKYSCGRGLCGNCTVHLDGQVTQSCVTRVSSVGEREITTIEGLSEIGDHPVQEAWIIENVAQCGYCQPGLIMTAAALLTNNPSPNDAEIDEAMAESLCRCGTYQRIRRAIHLAAEMGAGI